MLIHMRYRENIITPSAPPPPSLCLSGREALTLRMMQKALAVDAPRSQRYPHYASVGEEECLSKNKQSTERERERRERGCHRDTGRDTDRDTDRATDRENDSHSHGERQRPPQTRRNQKKKKTTA
jgi:hypothetical protein